MTVAPSADEVRDAADSLYQLIRSRIAVEGEPGDAEAFVTLARLMAHMFRGLWDGLRTSLSQGMEAEKLRTCGAALSIATDIWLELAQTLVKGAAEASQRLGRPVKGLPQLTEEVAGVQEVRSVARKLVDFVNAARSAPLDLKKLEQSEAAFAQGRFIKGKDVIARLRSRRAP